MTTRYASRPFMYPLIQSNPMLRWSFVTYYPSKDSPTRTRPATTTPILASSRATSLATPSPANYDLNAAEAIVSTSRVTLISASLCLENLNENLAAHRQSCVSTMLVRLTSTVPTTALFAPDHSAAGHSRQWRCPARSCHPSLGQEVGVQKSDSRTFV